MWVIEVPRRTPNSSTSPAVPGFRDTMPEQIGAAPEQPEVR